MKSFFPNRWSFSVRVSHKTHEPRRDVTYPRGVIQCVRSINCIDNWFIMYLLFKIIPILIAGHLKFSGSIFSNVIVFTCLVPRYQWIFSNITENAGTLKFEIRTTHVRYGYQWTSVFVTKKTRSSIVVSAIGTY